MASTDKVGERVQKIVVKGTVPVAKYGDVFRLFVGPANRMQPKRFDVVLQLEIEPSDQQSIDKNDPAIKQMGEAARQLGLEFEVDGAP
jgi:hypothetical protein